MDSDMMMEGEDPMMEGMMHGDMSGNGTMSDTTMVDTGDMMPGEDSHGSGMGDHGNMMGDQGDMGHGDMGHGDMGHGDMIGGMEHGNGNHDMNNNTGVSGGHLHGGFWAAGESNGFCIGQAGMVMIMDGFQWVLKGESTCINLYFPGWTLDSAGKVVGAMIGVILLAIATEAISKLRHNLSVKARNADLAERKRLSMIQTALHGVHAFTGYILMLATMTYSLELLLCVILGLVIGYATFGGDTYNHVTTNPCCAFLEDEAMEREAPAEESPGLQSENCCQPKETRTIAQSEVSNHSSCEEKQDDNENGVFSA